MAHNIEAYVGPNGSGKTLAAVERRVLPAWRRERMVVGNLSLYPSAVGYDDALFRPLRSWREIPRLGVHVDQDGQPIVDDLGQPWSITKNEGCVLFLDEITSCLPSRAAMSLPVELQRILNQLRKHDVQLVWTAPDWRRCDTILREVTQAVTLCRGWFPDRWVRVDERRRFPRRATDDNGRPIPVEDGWLPNRVFLWSTYDAQEFESFNTNTGRRLDAVARRRYWRSKHVAQNAYSSAQPVNLLDHLDEGGKCLNCGGSRPRRKCECGTAPHGERQRAEDAGPLPTFTGTPAP
jgi:hypothetical protein